ncbi:MAG: SusC/RagA family TonB-linked outer membrane protein [Salinibacter sp.]
MRIDRTLLSTLAGLFVVASLLIPNLAFAQPARISGTVTEASSGDPVPGVNVFIRELGASVAGTATDAEGQYSLEVEARFVRGQEVTLVFQFVGYQNVERDIQLEAGTQEISVEMQQDVLKLDETVITGSGEKVRKAQVPYAVDKVSEAEVTDVPAVTNPAAAIRGQVPGATVLDASGTPGTGPEIRLRGITSVTGDNSPLYVVDGAVIPGGLVDFDALNVKSIEVIKGSAAAAIYGSRAQNGVIRITTKSGEDLGQGTSQVRFRSQFGFTQLPNVNLQSRYTNQEVAKTSFVDPQGRQVEPGDFIRTENGQVLKAGYANADRDFEEWSIGRENGTPVAFQDNEYPQYFDHVDQVFDRGSFLRNNLSFSHRSQKTNFRIALSNVRNKGPMKEAKGFYRRNARLNLDHDLSDALTFSSNILFTDAARDDVTGKNGAFNPWPVLYFASPTVSMLQKQDNGKYVVQPDSTARQENPLYTNQTVTWRDERQRFVGTGQFELRPAPFLTVEGLFSLKSFNGNFTQIYPKGFQTSRPRSNKNQGQLTKDSDESRTWGANLKVTAARQFIGGLNTRVQAKVRAERQVFRTFNAQGSQFVTQGVYRFNNISNDPEVEDITAGSRQSDQRSLFGFVSTDVDWKGRYVLNALVRRDGSSLFGADERWHTYYRVGGAYRIAQEPWWPISQVGELKLRYSYGTGGGQPAFNDKFRTFQVSGGRISKQQLGNPNLEPSYQVEQSLGINFALFDRISGSFTYATSRVENQILNVGLPGYLGYQSQVRNAGTVESFSLEGKLNVAVLNRENTTLTTGLTFTRTQSTITEWDRTPLRFGPGNSFIYDEGNSLGAIFGNYYLTSKSELPKEWQQFSDQFAVNDEGYLVPVGAGNSWKDGIEKRLWGTDVDIDGDGQADFDWGNPLALTSDSALTQGQPAGDTKIGNSTPAFSLGWNTGFDIGGFSFSMLWQGEFDFDIYNFDRHWASPNHHTVDQANKPASKKKPNSYENAFRAYNNRYVEDGTYLKLRELSAEYTLNQSRIRGLFGAATANAVERFTVGIAANNILTLTEYSGYDPEVTSTGNTKQRHDGLSDYPKYRRISAKMVLTF